MTRLVMIAGGWIINMKQRILKLASPKPFKAVYKIKHYLRVYEDNNHPEVYDDYEVNTRTTRPQVLDNLNAQGYQFFDIMEVSYVDIKMETTRSLPRNFSKLRIVSVNVYEDDEDED